MLDYEFILEDRKTKHLFRKRKILTSRDDNNAICDDVSVISFCSNDYLNLSKNADVINAFKSGVDEYGVGGTSAQLICGYTKSHVQLEKEMAAFFNKDKALLFSTGYMANIGVLTTLIDKDEVIFADKLCHASIIDGIQYSVAQHKRYGHNDISHLNNLLQQCQNKNKWIVTEGVFSMDGDLALLPDLIKLKNKHNAKIILDDAHGIGVLGSSGKGTADFLNVGLNKIDLIVGTFGKGLGGFGAFVVGDSLLIDYLVQFCRPFIYTTSLLPSMTEAMLLSLDLIRNDDWRREKLHALIQHFREKAKEFELPLLESCSPIQPILIGDSEKVQRVGDELFKRGFWVGVIRPPTVPKETARLRISLNVEHTIEQIDNLLGNIYEAMKWG